VTEGTVTRWLKQEGDTVELDEPLLEVSTDKVDTEIPSPAAGVLTKIVAHEDDTVEIGGELAVIGDAAEAAEGGGAEQPAAEAAPEPQPEPEAQPEPAPQPQAEPEPAPASAAGEHDATGTSHPVLMPELGESVTEGTVTRWLKKVGDSVEVDEPLVEVSTDKVDTEIPSPVAGTLISITAEEGRGEPDRYRRRGQPPPEQSLTGEREARPPPTRAQENPAATPPEPTPAPQAKP
jgi:2-oxoglutarate dehydrogenase E2 component (dihydrolipoamide succinyltransferase)